MKIYSIKSTKIKDKQKVKKYLIIVSALILLVAGGSVWWLRHDYLHNLRPVSAVDAEKYFTIEGGSSVHKITQSLKDAGLIKSVTAFQWYVRTSEFNDSLKAGTYLLSPSMNSQDIVNKIVAGDVVRNLLTILPGKRIDQVKQAFKDAGYSDAQIEIAFSPLRYKTHPALASLPKGQSLEGYLYPDSYDHQANTSANTVVSAALDEIAKKLTPDIIAGFSKQGLTIFQGITLASIVEQEAASAKDRAKVAQVFLKRYKMGMMLGSDPTAYYGAIKDGRKPTVAYDSAYNTRIHTGLPAGPIGAVSISSMQAIGTPADSSYLFFIAGDDGNMYFSYTADEHQTLINKYCKIGCAVE